MVLDEPFTFTDKLSNFPNAVHVELPPDDGGRRRVPAVGHPDLSGAGHADGRERLADLVPLLPAATTRTRPCSGSCSSVFVPEADVVRVIDPAWQPGDALPSGSVPVANTFDRHRRVDVGDRRAEQRHRVRAGVGRDARPPGNNVVNNSPLRVGVVPPVPAPGLPGQRQELRRDQQRAGEPVADRQGDRQPRAAGHQRRDHGPGPGAVRRVRRLGVPARHPAADRAGRLRHRVRPRARTRRT